MIRIARFHGNDQGAIIYESVSMTAYPMMFRSDEAARAFLIWFEQIHGDLTEYEGDLYRLQEEWTKAANLAAAEAELTEWASARRDDQVRAAHRAGISKNRIHTITGIARTTIDRILKGGQS